MYMNFFRSIFFILVVFFCINILSVSAQSSVDPSIKKVDETESRSITQDSIREFIRNKTPESVSTKINKSIDWLEKERIDLGNKSNIKQISLKKEIINHEGLNKNNILEGDTNITLKLWQRIELYFFIIASYIFAHKVLFYVIPLILFYILIRSIFRLFN